VGVGQADYLNVLPFLSAMAERNYGCTTNGPLRHPASRIWAAIVGLIQPLFSYTGYTNQFECRLRETNGLKRDSRSSLRNPDRDFF
jgi:hypothetical protein